MKKYKIALVSAILILIALSIFFVKSQVGKNDFPKQIVKKTENQVVYPDVLALNIDGEYGKLYKVDEKSMTQINSIKNLSDLSYSKNVMAYLGYLSHGDVLFHNNINIVGRGNALAINDYFTAFNPRINNEGNYLAFRAFKGDSYDSAVGLQVYDIINKVYLAIDPSIVLSGDLYQWIDNENIVFYGVKIGIGDYGKIYKFNVKTKETSVFYDNLQGYCTYFSVIKDKGILYMENSIEGNRLYYYDIKTKIPTPVNDDIQNIYDSVVNNTSVYFAGIESNENVTSLYKFDLQDLSIKKINYDFPKDVDKNCGIVFDSKENVFFCGRNLDSATNDIYVYNIKNESISILTEQSGNYHLYSPSK